MFHLSVPHLSRNALEVWEVQVDELVPKEETETTRQNLTYGMHEKSMFLHWPFTSKGEAGMDFCNPTGSFTTLKPYRYLGGY